MPSLRVLVCIRLFGWRRRQPMTRLSARQTLLLILLPMLATFASQRLYLHLVGVHHVRANGFIIHHLFLA